MKQVPGRVHNPSATMASSSSSNSSSSGRATRSRTGGSIEDEAVPRPSKSLRRVQYCYELLKRNQMCSGCIHYLDAPESSKKKGPRNVTHTGDRFVCRTPWKQDPSDSGYYGIDRFQAVHDFIQKEHGVSAARIEAVKLFSPSATSTCTAPAETVHPPEKEDDVSPLSSDFLTTASTSDGRMSSKDRSEIALNSTIISSYGHDFEIIDIPSTHCIITKSLLERLRCSQQLIKDLQSGCQQGRFSGGSSLMRSLLAVAVTSCPALPLSQAANIIPMVVAGVLVDVGILDQAKVSSFSKSFPSETYLRDLVFAFAAENIYELGCKIRNVQVFLSCDKGNKKGVGHFVKVLSWYDNETKSVRKQLLDIDGTEGLTDDCGEAIAVSLKKVGSIKLQGQTTDSGGGGVLDGLHRSLEERQLVHPFYLVASCGLHNLQLSVANPIKSTMGEGGLDKKNLMQLLHSVYDLQESMDKEVWRVHVSEALKFLETYSARDTHYVGLTQGDQQFADKWELVKTFRHFNAMLTAKELKRTRFKIPAPVLTRWWTVGETARVLWSAYLLVLRISQQVINTTSSKPNKIASGLQPLLLELELFSDLALVNCFHSFYVSPHFDWMQSATDLSGVPGFQAHNTLGRYYLLVQDLQALEATMTTTHPSFKDFQDTLLVCPPQLRLHQESKAQKFISAALDAVKKHFTRWCNKSLLPAALLSERPLSVAVASAILNRELLLQQQELLDSKVHFRQFDIQLFHTFIASNISGDQAYPAMVLYAAELVLQFNHLDLRDMYCPEYRGVKEFLYYMYLPLASHTQFVEAGVKEAKNVSITDRSEMLRSAYAVSRSARVHSIEDLRCLKSTERIEALITSALRHHDDHSALKADSPNYLETIEAIAKSMREEHFKQVRVAKATHGMLAKVNKNKKENALQQKTGVDRTHAVEGLFPYGKLVKKLHFDALKVELLFRGCTEEDINDLTITQRKNRLKELEIERLKDFDGDKSIGTKAFKPLSGASFPAS
jgi:hypothetical protein